MFVSFAVLSLALTFLVSQVTLAQTASSTSATPSSECKLQDAVDDLLKVKDSDTSTPGRDKAELSARKNVISQIAICSELELESFKKRLSDLDLKSNDEKDELLRKKFLGDFDAGNFYFKSVSDQLATSSLDLTGVKELAKNMAAWRESFYIPTLSKANDFLLVLEDAEAVKTAQTRFDKISFSLGAVKLDGVLEIKKLLNSSSEHIIRASALNKEAHDLLWDITILPQSSSTPSSTPSAATTSDETTQKENASSSQSQVSPTPPIMKVLPLVKDSLIELRKAYADYLSISNIVKKYLGF